MEVQDYPAHLDLAWLAVDRRGRLGVFTTAGEGPIPMVYLRDATMLARVTEAIDGLPLESGHELFARVPRPDDFIDFARRGLFSFDWQSDSTRAYAIQARPTTPVSIVTAGLPKDLVSLLAVVTSDSLDFESATVDVAAAFECAARHGVGTT
jgi:hypothetical protein